MPRKPAEPDPRHRPFIDFAFETYREKFGVTLVVDGRAIGAVTQMLKATRPHMDEYSLEKLQAYWLCSMERADKFDRKQPPLPWFCSRIHRWAAECNGSASGRKVSAGTEAAKDWIQRRLNNDRKS